MDVRYGIVEQGVPGAGQSRGMAGRCGRALVCALLVAAMPAAWAGSSPPPQYGRLPIAFEANHGQVDAAARYFARGPAYALLLRPEGADLYLQYQAPVSAGARDAVRTTILQTRLVDAQAPTAIEGREAMSGTSNYLLGRDATAWMTDVAQYRKVRYSAVYPGIDLVYHGSQQQLEYDFVVAPGADPARIGLRFAGTSAPPTLDAAGNLVLSTAGGDVIQHRPEVYQMVDGRKVGVDGAYRIEDDRIAFEVGAYDRSRSLVIDPLLAYRLYVPGINALQATSIAVGPDGSAYIAGYAPAMRWLTGLPVLGPVLRQVLTYDAFVAKLEPSGDALAYTTFIGGSDDDQITDIAVTPDGEVVVTGMTYSNEFPVEQPVQSSKGGYADAFVARIGAQGKTLVYSTYLGGNADDVASSLALDDAGNAYIAGYTESENFPIQSALQATHSASGDDAFVARLSADGSTLSYSTFLGGSGWDAATRITVDGAGQAYVVGVTQSEDLPVTPGAFKTAIVPYCPSSTCYLREDAFLAKVGAGGDTLMYATYLGGAQNDVATGVAVDNAGRAVVSGWTLSDDFPTTAALYAAPRGGTDAFVTRFSATADALVYSTYLGGSSSDMPNDLALDADGSVYVTGYTRSQNFPTRNAVQPFNAGGQDLFLSKLAPAGDVLSYSTFLGAAAADSGYAVALGDDGSAYVAGSSQSANFPTKGPVQGASWGAPSGDAIAAKFEAGGSELAYSTYLGETNVYLNFSPNGYRGTSPSDQALSIHLPLRGQLGCTLRALPTDLIGDLSIIYPSRIPCGEISPAP